jgi:hypothetical protein
MYCIGVKNLSEHFKLDQKSKQNEFPIFSVDVQTDAFLSHDWKEDEFGRNNHDRVAKVNILLKEHGITTWFDHDNLKTGHELRTEMARAIDNTKVIIVFVTNRYMDKVNSGNNMDNVNYEFEYASNKFGKQGMIPVVMEERMKNQKTWDGLFGDNLLGLMYVDLTSDDEKVFEEKIKELIQRIISIRDQSSSLI